MHYLESLIQETQSHITVKYPEILRLGENSEQLRSYIKQFLESKRLVWEKDFELESLLERIIDEMMGFSILSKYLRQTNIEEININSWEDIKISTDDGRVEASATTFLSPRHAVDIVRRMLSESGVICDDARPIVVSPLPGNIRVTAMTGSVVDEEVGIACSIRIVNPKHFTREELIRFGTASGEMLDALETLFLYGASVCFVGATGSGKTTLMGYIAGLIPYESRVVTIEESTREFNFVKRGPDGSVLNNVVHLRTRHSAQRDLSITMRKLLETALTINPDYLIVAEMKSEEAYIAISAANTGHAMMTTTHANSCIDAYARMTTLAKESISMDDQTLLSLATKGFPITVFTAKGKDHVRRVLEIAECIGVNKDGKIEMNTLFSFDAERGEFVKQNPLSKTLLRRLEMSGAPRRALEILGGGK